MAKEVKEMVDASDPETLKVIAGSCREKAAEVARIVQPHSIFAIKYEALAKACDDLIELFNERGHVGIPPEYK